jgi:predicted RNA-binding protein (virulence factor B family)
VYVYVDKMTDRIAASAKLENFVEKRDIMLKQDQEVDLLIGKQTPLGFNVIVDNQYMGLIYENEIFKNVDTGDRTKGYVRNIREDDKIDIILQKPGYAAVEPNAEKILQILKANDGFLDLNDKSDPDEISNRLEMSKKTFKKAIGGLFRQKLIVIEDDGVRLRKSTL